MTKDDALVFTDRATNHLLSYSLRVGLLQVRWATLVHDTLLFADSIKPERVDDVLFHFQMFYCMVCAQAGIRPHHFEEATWQKAIAELNRD